MIYKKFVVFYFILFFLLIFLLSVPGLKAFTIEDILSSPFPYELTTWENGQKIAWVFNTQGRNNIWIAQGPDFKPVKITSYSKDNGKPIHSLKFSPDGTTIVYVRGPGPNSRGIIANPTSNPEGAKQEIWAVKIKKKKTQLLGQGNYPSIFPKGETIVFRKKGKVYKVPIDGSKKAESLFFARGYNHNLSFSPDGSRLAFVSNRNDHSFIGIYDISNKKIRWILPDVYRDISPVWSPDGKYVAFIRFPGAKSNEKSSWFTSKTPFSIYVADLTTGKGKKIWHTDTGGGFSQYYQYNPLKWASHNKLIFFSEHDGWMHIYSLDVNTGNIIKLTPGQYEVESMTLSADKKNVVFCSNKDDIDRRHLWTVSIEGNKLRLLTQGDGLEWSPNPLSDNKHIAFIDSSAIRPASIEIINTKNNKIQQITEHLIPDNFPIKQMVAPKQVIFKSGDGLNIHGQLFLPEKSSKNKKYPAIIYMHGGPIRQMLLGWHYSSYYHRCYAMNQYLANHGYVVLSVNYRAGIGYGSNFRTASKQGPKGSSEYQDIVAAGEYLQKRPEVNASKIGLWGGSYGGLLTALGLARDSDLFSAGVDLHGVHDWSLRARRRGPKDWNVWGKQEMDLAYQSSPVADVQFWTSPVLFIHGDDDRNVDFIQTTDLVMRLKELGNANVETLIFPDEVHSFLLHKNWLAAFKSASDFFDRFLKNK